MPQGFLFALADLFVINRPYTLSSPESPDSPTLIRGLLAGRPGIHRRRRRRARFWSRWRQCEEHVTGRPRATENRRIGTRPAMKSTFRLEECSLLSHASITIAISPYQTPPGASGSAPSAAHAGTSQDTALASPPPAAAVARDAEGAWQAHGPGAAGGKASVGGGGNGGGAVIEKGAGVSLVRVAFAA